MAAFPKKYTFCLPTVEIAAHFAIAVINDGGKASTNGLQSLEIEPGAYCKSFLKQLDK